MVRNKKQQARSMSRVTTGWFFFFFQVRDQNPSDSGDSIGYPSLPCVMAGSVHLRTTMTTWMWCIRKPMSLSCLALPCLFFWLPCDAHAHAHALPIAMLTGYAGTHVVPCFHLHMLTCRHLFPISYHAMDAHKKNNPIFL